MPEVTRRRLLSSAAAGAGGVLASSLLPPALARAAAEGPRRGSLRDVKHVVIHMQENRSFDHYFGTLGGRARLRRPERADPAQQPAHERASRSSTSTTRDEPRRLPAAVAPRHARPPARRRSRRRRTPGPSSTSRSTSRSRNVRRADHRATTTGSRRHLAADGAAATGLHDGLLRAPGHPVPLRAGRDVHAVRRLPLLAARPDVAQPHVPAGPGRSTRAAPAAARSPRNVVPSPTTGTPYTWTTYPERLTEGRDQLAHLPGGGRLRHEHARVLRRLPGREARLAAVRGRADDLPARPVRVGRQARPAADRLVDRPDLGPERAPGLPPGVGRELPGVEAERGRREPRSVVQDRVHRQLRRERRAVRPRRAAAAARRAPPASSSRSARARTGRSAAASASRPSSISPWTRRRLRRHRAVRPHLGAPVPRAADRRHGDEHHRLAAPDVRRPDLGARLLERQGHDASRGRCRTRSASSGRPSRRSRRCRRRRSRAPTRRRPSRRSDALGCPWTPQPRRSVERADRKALPATTSRFEENRTTHARRLQQRQQRQGVPGAGSRRSRTRTVDAGATARRVRSRNRRRQRRDRRHLDVRAGRRRSPAGRRTPTASPRRRTAARCG